MNSGTSDRERLLELLSDRALFGLDETEHSEVQTLLASCFDVDAECMDQVAAMLELGHISTAGAVAMPAELRQKIQQGMVPFFGTSTPTPDDAMQNGPITPLVKTELPWWSTAATWSGWILAAGLLFALLTNPFGDGSPSVVDVTSRRAELIANGSDLIQRAWQTTDDPAAAGASGDIVWSNDLQQGFMRIVGLEVNDPDVSQYQLWIFDNQQKHPVDGGVFDIPAGKSEVMIAIDPKIRVGEPTIFAVTVEKPGGVVVSDKERVPLLAPPAEGN